MPRSGLLLVLEFPQGAENLREHHVRLGRFPPSIGGQIGRHSRRPAPPVALGRPHRRAAPGPLPLHRPRPSSLSRLSQGGLELVRLVQSAPALAGELDRLAEAWRPLAPVHHDLKWENILVAPAATGEPRVVLVDWEHASLGDPAWDVGSALSQYLALWACSVPVGDVRRPPRTLAWRGSGWPK